MQSSAAAFRGTREQGSETPLSWEKTERFSQAWSARWVVIQAVVKGRSARNARLVLASILMSAMIAAGVSQPALEPLLQATAWVMGLLFFAIAVDASDHSRFFWSFVGGVAMMKISLLSMWLVPELLALVSPLLVVWWSLILNDS